jgi:hypothetical protein
MELNSSTSQYTPAAPSSPTRRRFGAPRADSFSGLLNATATPSISAIEASVSPPSRRIGTLPRDDLLGALLMRRELISPLPSEEMQFASPLVTTQPPQHQNRQEQETAGESQPSSPGSLTLRSERSSSFTTVATASSSNGNGAAAARALRHATVNAAARPTLSVEELPLEEPDVPADLKCPVCLEVFASPVTLSCFHSVCKEHVLDLAAARAKRADDPTGCIIADCPKCRAPTNFASAQAIRINTEMQGIVDMMMRMLQRTASMERLRTASANTIHSNRSTPRRRPPVMFEVDDDDNDDEVEAEAPMSSRPNQRVRFAEGNDETSPSSPPKPRSILRSAPSAPAGDSSSPPSTAGLPAPTAASAAARPLQDSPQRQTVTELARDIEAKRQQMVFEREKRNREAVEAYKRTRMAEITARQQGLPDDDEDVLVYDADVNVSPNARYRGDPKKRALEEAKRQAQEDRERAKMHQELQVQAAVAAWLQDDHGVYNPQAETEEFARRMQAALGTGDAGNVLTNTMKRDAMRQAAEARLPPMPSVPSATRIEATMPFGGASDVRQRAQQRSQRDIEVELVLLEAERAVQREHDDELSRAEMADLAEKRAREQIAQFKRAERANAPWSRPTTGSYEAPPPPPVAAKPGYAPKLSRLRRIM